MQVIPSLLDFSIGDSGNGRVPIVTTFATQFYDQVLEPLLDDSANFASTIYAWEIMNKRSRLTANYYPKDRHWYALWHWLPSSPLVSSGQLTTFLSDGLARIKARIGFDSTVGHRYLNDMKDYPCGTAPQFHYYPTTGNPACSDPLALPDANTFAPSPILGELGSLSSHGGPWPELNGRDSGSAGDRVAARLKAADAKHYRLAMVWPDLQGDVPDTLKLSSDAQQGILTYLASR
jgi:hypothetical protein